ncbi:MAG: signal peptidase I [Gemmatimonadota bacterium]|nr:signal peptidase I [Gemmatimonadota bacterium]
MAKSEKGRRRNRRREGTAGTGRRRERSKSERAGKTDRRPRESGALEWLKSLAVALVLFLVLRAFVVQTFVITSGSMEDTLLVGDMLLVNRLAMGSAVPGLDIRIPGYSEPERGDILVFDPPHEETLMLIKRLVGVPGDTLAMRDRVLHLNGEPVDEPYVRHDPVDDERHPWMRWQRDYLVADVDPSTYAPTRDNWGPIVIPEGRYFMLGDNRERSLDSRYWGLLERWRLEGRAVFTYFSYNRDSHRPFPALREIRWDRIGRAID